MLFSIGCCEKVSVIDPFCLLLFTFFVVVINWCELFLVYFFNVQFFQRTVSHHYFHLNLNNYIFVYFKYFNLTFVESRSA